MNIIKWFIIVIIFTITNLKGQENNFGIGITYQPFFYQSYNKVDWNNLPLSYPDNPNSFNGYALGLVFEKNLNDFFSIYSELTFSLQNQKHVTSNHIGEGYSVSIYNVDIFEDFSFIKFPIVFNYNLQLGYESSYYLSIGIGGQLSYLSNYYTSETVYDVDRFTGAINYDFYTAKYIDAKNNLEYYFWEEQKIPPGYKHVVDPNPNWTYKNWQYGVLGFLSVKKIFFSKYLLSIGVRYEYDFTDSEQNPSLIGSYRINDSEKKKPTTHNIRKGLSFSFMYLFD